MNLKTSTIDELCNVEYGTRVTRRNSKGTTYPVYGGGGETFSIDKTNRKNRVIVARFAISPKCTRFIKGNFFLNDSGLTLSPKKKDLSQEFLDNIIISLNDSIYKLGRGTAQRNLDMKQFRLLKITYPQSLIEQERILDKLKMILPEIDNVINIEKKKIKLIKKIESNFLAALLNKVNDLKKVKLEEICKIKGRIGYRGYTKNDITTKDNGAISLSPSNIMNNKLIFKKATYVSWEKYNESPEIMIYPKDIIFCKTGSTYGKTAYIENFVGKATLNPQLVVLKDIKCNNKYLFYCMLSDNFKHQIENIIGGSAMPTLSQKDLSKNTILLPPENIQDDIVNKIENTIKCVEEILKNSSLKIKDFTVFKEKLIQKEVSNTNE